MDRNDIVENSNLFRRKRQVTVRIRASREKRQRHKASLRFKTYGPKATVALELASTLGLAWMLTPLMDSSAPPSVSGEFNAALRHCDVVLFKYIYG